MTSSNITPSNQIKWDTDLAAQWHVRTGKGYGTALMRLELDENDFTDVLLPSYYVPEIRYNLFACEKAKYEQGIWYMSKDNTTRRMHNDSIIGYTKYEDGIPIVRTIGLS